MMILSYNKHMLNLPILSATKSVILSPLRFPTSGFNLFLQNFLDTGNWYVYIYIRLYAYCRPRPS